ncbi:hypothetical protein N7456_001167 [Penicillium angulare]|uniref:Uncharacterized protein n=1 Tax=Penicillium angulare TaxID=116970 RepID=A0A9W9GDE8_9EURO|nr:hypothetical protein N7456_001167 [Penicillium angulare]
MPKDSKPPVTPDPGWRETWLRYQRRKDKRARGEFEEGDNEQETNQEEPEKPEEAEEIQNDQSEDLFDASALRPNMAKRRRLLFPRNFIRSLRAPKRSSFLNRFFPLTPPAVLHPISHYIDLDSKALVSPRTTSIFEGFLKSVNMSKREWSRKKQSRWLRRQRHRRPNLPTFFELSQLKNKVDKRARAKLRKTKNEKGIGEERPEEAGRTQETQSGDEGTSMTSPMVEADEPPVYNMYKDSTGQFAPIGPHRTWPKQDSPITSLNAIPSEWEWDVDELDLYPDDIQGNIERCKERIETGILPDYFERKLQTFLEKEETQRKIQESEPGISSEVASRLGDLKEMQKYWQNEQAQYKDQEAPTCVKVKWKAEKRIEWINSCLLNIQGLISAYRNHELEHYDNNTWTIWQKGKLVRGPWERGTVDEWDLWLEFHSQRGCWVEGLGAPGPAYSKMVQTIPPIPNQGRGMSQHYVYFGIRVPGTEQWVTLEFLDDTGATAPMVSLDDIEAITAVCGQEPVHLGGEIAKEALGLSMFGHRFALEVAVVNNLDERTPMTRWVNTIFFAVDADTGDEAQDKEIKPPRLSGSWWRHMLYTATAPDNRRCLYVGTTKQEVIDLLPDVDHNKAKPPYVEQTIDNTERIDPPSHKRAREEDSEELPKSKKAKGFDPSGKFGELKDEKPHQPSYTQYLEWLEKHNEEHPDDEELIPTWDDYQTHRVDQKNWTTETEGRLRRPSLEHYYAWLLEINIMREAEAVSRGRPPPSSH